MPRAIPQRIGVLVLALATALSGAGTGGRSALAQALPGSANAPAAGDAGNGSPRADPSKRDGAAPAEAGSPKQAAAASDKLSASISGPLAASAPVRASRDAAARDQGLLAFLLPYTPSLFDLAVVGARNLAVVTYRGRRYDPVTRALVVDGLTVARDAFHLSVAEVRISADQAIFTGIALDTAGLDLDPAMRRLVDKIGAGTLTGSLVIAVDADAPTADYAVNASAAIDGAGRLDLSADLLGFHILAPLGEAEHTLGIPDELKSRSDRARIVGRLRQASLDFRDAGLTAALYDVVGRSQGLSPEAARGTAAMVAGIGVASLTGSLAGPPSPELKSRAAVWSAAVQAFLRDPGRLTVALNPPQPFDLSVLNDRKPTAEDVFALAPTVLSGPDRPVALVDPAKIAVAPDGPIEATLPVAKALIDGVGLPQDLARGVALTLGPADAGNRVAIALLSRALALDPGVAIAQEKLRGAYVALLLAGADGLVSEGGSADALRDRLSPEEIAAAEDEALTRWRATPSGTEQHAAELSAFEHRDWSAIRNFAYAYYEGAAMPRNLMRAYGWSSIAAAGGDRIAASLRDDLTRAVAAGRIVLPLDRARQATDDLWKVIVTGRPAAQPAMSEPATSAANGPDGEGVKDKSGGSDAPGASDPSDKSPPNASREPQAGSGNPVLR